MIKGNFATIDEHRIYVRISTHNNVNPLPTIDIDVSDNIRFADDPVNIDITHDELSSPLYKGEATVSFVCKDSTVIDHIIAMSQYGKVFLSIDDTTANKILFTGIVEAKTFNQDYAESWNTIDIHAYDYISTLENYNYKDWLNWGVASSTASLKSIREILLSLFTGITFNYHENAYIYYDNSAVVDGNASMLDCLFHEHMFYGDDPDDAMDRMEILTEILKYFNLTARQYNNSIYIYSAPRRGKVVFNRIDDPSRTKTIDFSTVAITQGDYRSDDTQISYDEPIKSINVNVELDVIDTLFEDILSDDNVTSPYTCYTKIARVFANYDYNGTLKEDDDKADYMIWYGKVELPVNMDMQFYDIGTHTIRPVSDLFYVNGTNTLDTQWKAFYRARWQSYFIPFMFSSNNKEYKDKRMLVIKDRGGSTNRNFVINYNTNTADGQYGNTAARDVIQAISDAGMIHFNNITETMINPSSPDVTNCIVFSGNIQYATEEYEGIEWRRTTDLVNWWNAILYDENKQRCKVGGVPTGEYIDKFVWDPSTFWTASMFHTKKQQFFYQFYNSTEPYSDSWLNARDLEMPSIDINGTIYYTTQALVDNDIRSTEEMKWHLTHYWGPEDTSVIHDYIPIYDLDNTTVKGIRQAVGFTITKVPVLICELKVGDKYCVEVQDPDNADLTKFVWMTQAQATAAGISHLTFTIGYEPVKGDTMLNTFDIQNNVIDDVDIDINGEAVLIKQTDNLSGDISFKILAPFIPMTPKQNGSVWSTCYEMNPDAPDVYAYSCWWYNHDMTRYIGLHMQQLIIKDFECAIVSDNKQIEEASVDMGTTIIYSNERPEKPEEYDFSIASGLTMDEYIKNNVKSSPAWNYIYNGNSPVMSLSTPGYNNMKGEVMYIQRMYDMMSISPKHVITTLGDEHDMNDIFTFAWDTTHTYYPIGCQYNIKMCTKTFDMIAHNPWTV